MGMNCEAGFMCAQVSRTVHQAGGSCTGTNTRAANFRYGWTFSHMKFVGVGFLGAIMGSSTRLLP